MSDDLATSLPVSVRLRPDQGVYEFGVTFQGAFVVISTRKTGGVDDDIARAKDAVEAAQPVTQAPSPQNEPPVEPAPSV